MDNDELLTIRKFAAIARTFSHKLLHYEKLGLLIPVSRGEDNNYRYYHPDQITQVHFIKCFQELGLSLSRIGDITHALSPALTLDILQEQYDAIEEQMIKLANAKKLLRTLRQSIESCSDIKENEITIQSFPAEAIILGELNDYSNGKTAYDALRSFCASLEQNYPHTSLNYPIWRCFSKEQMRNKDWGLADRFYSYNPDGSDRKPAALYAVGYMRGWYGNGKQLYQRMLDYIDNSEYELCGNTYEEYPLNEICVSDKEQYLIRIMMHVQKKA
jgi:DNA-binding transcriptional MerR regulator